MLQINPFLDCTLYSGIIVHIARNNQAFGQLRILLTEGSDYLPPQKRDVKQFKDQQSA